MKKAYFSPVASLLMSLSLALGILVSDLSGYKLLTSAHAQEGSCGSQGGGMVVSNTVSLANGVALNGISVRNVVVNGQLVSEGVIAGQVQIVGSDIVNANGVLVGGIGGGDTTGLTGVLVGGDGGEDLPCIDGVLVGGDGGDDPTPGGVLVGGISGEGNISLSGATVNASGTATGGTLTGDGITVNNGVITGVNLLLSGTTINGGSISGTITSIQITPSN